MSILCRREGIELETDLESDSACLKEIAQQIAALDADIHCLRDLTRGGLSSALNELAESSSVGMEIVEHHVPLAPAVKASCELLGLDPFHVACEGRFVAIVPADSSTAVLETMRANELGQGAAIIGKVVSEYKGTVVLQSTVGGRRILDKLSGDQLPRIC
jgi:hydrogenase expression/formation protein HypE